MIKNKIKYILQLHNFYKYEKNISNSFSGACDSFNLMRQKNGTKASTSSL